jgi:hypothetical protein
VGRSISGYLWAYTHRHLVILRDNQRTEDYRCSSVDLDTGQEITLTGRPAFRSFVWRASRDYPAEMLFGLNERDRRYFDVVRIDVTTGASRLVFENPGFSGLLMGDTLSVRLAVRVRPDGSAEVVDLSRSDSPTLSWTYRTKTSSPPLSDAFHGTGAHFSCRTVAAVTGPR